jgi:hypothetical protein
MSDMLETTFPYYPGKIWKAVPLGTVSLEEFIKAHIKPKENIKVIFNQIAQAEKDGDLEKKGLLKQNNLFYFTPCVTLDGVGRSYSSITGFTGLLVLDFDHIDNAEEFRDLLFERMKSIVVAYISPSGKGVKFFVKIPTVNSVDEFKEYFYGIAFYMERFVGFDPSSQNPVLPVFLSWDENLRFRENPETWTTRGLKIDEFRIIDGDFEPLENVSEEDRQTVLRIYSNGIGRIEDNGHPQVLSYSLMLWGYCAANYISELEAEEHIIECISNSVYLSKNTRGYIKSAMDMRKTGMSSPLFLKDCKNG